MHSFEIHIHTNCEKCKYLSDCINAGEGCCDHFLYKSNDNDEEKEEES